MATFHRNYHGKTMIINEKRIYVAVLIGLGLSLVPALLSHITSNAKHVDLLFQWMGIILLPGLLVALPLSGGNIHDPNLVVATVASALFYSVLFYFLLTLLAWLRRGVNTRTRR